MNKEFNYKIIQYNYSAKLLRVLVTTICANYTFFSMFLINGVNQLCFIKLLVLFTHFNSLMSETYKAAFGAVLADPQQHKIDRLGRRTSI